MRALLDENLPQRLKTELSSAAEVHTVQEQGWSSKSNGELLELADDRYDALLTMDRGIEFQQYLAGRKICVVLIRAPSNRFADIEPHISEIIDVLAKLRPAEVMKVGG